MKREKKKSCIVYPRYKKPNIFLYAILWIASFIAKRRWNVYVNKEQKRKVRKLSDPVLVIANHQSSLDFGVLVSTLFPRRLAFVIAANIYYHKRYAPALRLIKCGIPKKQFAVDYECVKSIKKMIESGVSVAIYGEGRCSIDGTNGEVIPSLYKLIKWLNIPVVYVKTKGMYLTRPRYATDVRRGKVEVLVEEIISKDELKDITIDEIKERVEKWTEGNDFLYQKENNIAFRGKKGTTIGLECLLYKCPKCKAEFSHSTKGNRLKCGECGNEIELDEYGKITPIGGSVAFDRVDIWSDYQRQSLKKEIAENESYQLSAPAKLLINSDDSGGFEEQGLGYLKLNREGFLFVWENGDELSIPIPNPPALAIDLKSHIDFFIGTSIYRFLFTGKAKPIKFDIALQILAL